MSRVGTGRPPYLATAISKIILRWQFNVQAKKNARMRGLFEVHRSFTAMRRLASRKLLFLDSFAGR